MANILYVDDRHESSEFIEWLDKTDVEYEIRYKCEAEGKRLPLLVLGGKELNYKKAKRYLKERVIE